MPLQFIKVYDFAKHGAEPQKLNSTRTIDVDGKRICLARTESGYYAVNDRCPHAGARLGQGWCEGDMVVCPVHRYRYDLRTGRGLQGDYVEPYPVEVRKDGVYIGIETRRWWWPF